MDRSVDDFDPRVGELLDEYLAAAQGGAAPDREAFLAAHPEVAGDLRTALAGFEFIERAEHEVEAVASNRDEALECGTLGDFRIIREAGRGGMGVVYEAEQISLGRRVALKVLPFAAVLDERQLQRFKHEAQSAALLHHTNIVPIYSVGTERGVHYYAMEFVEGRTLAAVIGELRSASRTKRPSSGTRARDRRPTARAAVEASPAPDSSAEAVALTPEGTTETPGYCRAVARLGVQAAEALDHAHQNGVVHRDVKPANLMVDARGHLWIADFGLARSRVNTNLTMTGAIVGTLGYMSPEQALGKHVTLDHRTDVYSLGVTLIEALTLEPAFAGDDPRKVIQDIAFRPPTRPQRLNAAVSPALETILLKAVAKDPETRYASAQEMADDLRRFLDDKPVLARRAPLLDRATLWARRHRAAVVAAAAVLVVAVVALGVSTVLIAAEKRHVEDANQETQSALADSRRDAACAEDAFAESRVNAQRAEVNFGKALEAVDLMLSRVGDEQLKGVPGMEVIRFKLLEDAATFYRGFIDESGAGEAVQLETARRCLRLGRIYDSMAQIDAAGQMFDRAKGLLLPLVAADELRVETGDASTAPVVQASAEATERQPWSSGPAVEVLMSVESARAGVLGDRSQEQEALDVYRAVVTLAERHAQRHPNDARAASAPTRALRHLGDHLAHLEQYPEARDCLTAAVARSDAIVGRFPTDPNVLREASFLLCSIAGLEYDTERWPEAEKAFERALVAYEPAAAGPADANEFTRRAEVLENLGMVRLRLEKLDGAERALRAARDATRRQADEYPRYPYYGRYAARCAGLHSVALWALGRDIDAQAGFADSMARYDRLGVAYAGVPQVTKGAADDLEENGRWLEEAGRPAEAEAVRGMEARLRR